MSLSNSWDYNGKKITVYYTVVNAYIRGTLSRANFVKQLAPKLTHDPLVLVEILQYLDGFRELMRLGKPIVEQKGVPCRGCGDYRELNVEDHREFDGIKAKYLINFKDCDCYEDYEDLDCYGDQ